MSKSGILKLKSKYEEKSINLQVFAYSSKLFRDDFKALELDRESHLIPAPYDSNLMISRYDVRATILSDIAHYEAVSDTFNRFDGLSDSEKQAEILAEEERYFSLYRNEVEEEMYKEEQLKREALSATLAYKQVAFDYDQPLEEPIGPQAQPTDADTDDGTPFIPNERLDLPADMEIPPTEKLNQIIEKTAKFISSQGAQMEILLKTKQSSNPQFNFLNHDGQYNAYYKHILAMMKRNTYPWQEAAPSETKNEENSNSCENGNGVESNGNQSAIFIPKIQYKPSADCAYTQLISKITKAPISELERKSEEEKSAEGSDKKKKVEALGLLQSYNSSDDSDASENEEDFLSIPPEIQVTIDKTALYVAKNGPEFEEKLKIKQSETFKFLNADNEHHAYYKMKVKQNQASLNIPSEPTVAEKPKTEAVKTMPKAPPPPVCFSIKSKEEKQPLKSTMASSDEEQNQQLKASEIIPEAPSPPKISNDVEEELERQVDIVNAEREEKLAKARLNDKLLISARERLGMLPKEKMLQIERKKRAMMFINKNIKGSNGSAKDEGDVVNLVQEEDSNDSSLTAKSSPKVPSKHSSRSRSRRKSSTSRSSSSRSSTSSRSSDSSPRRKRSKKSHRKRKHRKSSRSRSRSRHRSRSHKKYSSRRRR